MFAWYGGAGIDAERRAWVRWVRRVALTVSFAIATVSAAQAAVEVRVLISVSRSMKQNDPGNPRVPAMHLMSQLLPLGTQVGVWRFAADAALLIPAAEVDEAGGDESPATVAEDAEDTGAGEEEGGDGASDMMATQKIDLTAGAVSLDDPSPAAESPAPERPEASVADDGGLTQADIDDMDRLFEQELDALDDIDDGSDAADADQPR